MALCERFVYRCGGVGGVYDNEVNGFIVFRDVWVCEKRCVDCGMKIGVPLPSDFCTIIVHHC